MQTWSGSASGRGPTLQVLIESPDPALAVSDFGAFTAAGIDVALCHGPDHTTARVPGGAGRGLPAGRRRRRHPVRAGRVGR